MRAWILALVLLPLGAHADATLALRRAPAMPEAVGSLAISFTPWLQVGDDSGGAVLPVVLRTGVASWLDLEAGGYVHAPDGRDGKVLFIGAPSVPAPLQVAPHVTAGATAALLRSTSAVLSARLVIDRSFDANYLPWAISGGALAATRVGDFVFEGSALARVTRQDGVAEVRPDASVRASWVLGRLAPSIGAELDSTPGPLFTGFSPVPAYALYSRLLGGVGLAAYVTDQVRLDLELRGGGDLDDPARPSGKIAAVRLGVRVDLEPR